MDKRQLFLLITSLLITITSMGQDLKVRTMTRNVGDLSASTYERKDLNGTACALVKVSLAAKGATFEGNVIQPVEYKTGEYWVYMSKGSRELRIKHPQTKPLHVKFSDYGIKKVESKATYDLSILMPEIEEGVAMAKADEPQLPDWLNSNQPNRWVGISPPTKDRKKARSAAIINAVLGYMRAKKEGKCKCVALCDITTEQDRSNVSASIVAKVTYVGFNCEIVDEYYNSRGEYFVRCGFVDHQQSKNKLEVYQTLDDKQTDNKEDALCKTSILLFLNNQGYTCDFEYDSSHENGLSCQVKINDEPLIPTTNMEYDKCQWKQTTEEGRTLHFLSDETGQSLGTAILSTYCILPFIPKSMKCVGRSVTDVMYNDESDLLKSYSSFELTADTLCHPTAILFVSLSGGNLSMQIGNVNFNEKELETWIENFNEPVGKRWLETLPPFAPNCNDGAISRLIKTISPLINGYASIATKYYAETSSEIGDNKRIVADITETEFDKYYDTYSKKIEVKLHDIGVRWYFENPPTPEQKNKMERQFFKTKIHPHWPGAYIIAEIKKK